jgi:hypothetical protein
MDWERDEFEVGKIKARRGDGVLGVPQAGCASQQVPFRVPTGLRLLIGIVRDVPSLLPVPTPVCDCLKCGPA